MFRMFVTTNMVLIHFGYGLVFFLMGFGALLAGRSFRQSRLAVAQSLPWLAAFGMLVGLAQWGVVFIPLQAAYLSATWLTGLHVLHSALLLVAHASLLAFGARLLARWQSLRLILPLSLALGMAAFALTLPMQSVMHDWQLAAHAVAAYGLGLPGAILAARGLLLQRRDVAAFYPRSARSLRVAAWAFILSVPIGPLAGGEAAMLWGIPVQVPLALGGLVLAWSLLTGLEALRMDNARRVERAERREAMLEERYRLAKDLQDGVIQDLFAAGMLMGATGQDLPDADQAALRAAERQMQSIVDRLRSYVMDLEPVNPADADIYTGLQRLVDDFRANTLLPVSLHLGPDLALDGPEAGAVYAVAQEALSNVRRHARASLVSVRFSHSGAKFTLIIADNGCGCPSEMVRGPGLDRMARSAEAVDGSVSISPAPGGGTQVVLELPD